jgi:hypothetical protein
MGRHVCFCRRGGALIHIIAQLRSGREEREGIFQTRRGLYAEKSALRLPITITCYHTCACRYDLQCWKAGAVPPIPPTTPP